MIEAMSLREMPPEVRGLVDWINLTTYSDHYCGYTPIAWVRGDVFQARRVFDQYYEERGTYLGQPVVRLIDSVDHLSRGEPAEFHCGDWWVLCGFDFD